MGNDDTEPAWKMETRISLRDEFAKAALQSLRLSISLEDGDEYLLGVGRISYRMADAMLKARKEAGKP